MRLLLSPQQLVLGIALRDLVGFTRLDLLCGAGVLPIVLTIRPEHCYIDNYDNCSVIAWSLVWK